MNPSEQVLDEFSLIDRYFASLGCVDTSVELGVGDDAAILAITPGSRLVTAVDTLIGGVHFPREAPAEDVGQRCLRVNLSDFAAMAARPRWFTLALTLPSVDESWLADFSRGLAQAAGEYGCSLVGGDTTRGELTISINLMGEIHPGHALCRRGARPGDRVFVTGALGEGAAALSLLQGNDKTLLGISEYLLDRFYRPVPKLAEASLISGIASAAIDISDGLLADAGHLARRSGVAMKLYYSRLPVAENLRKLASDRQLRDWLLGGGDDYELCFTVPEAGLVQVNRLISEGQVVATCIGEVLEGSGVHCYDDNGQPMEAARSGYRHF